MRVLGIAGAVLLWTLTPGAGAERQPNILFAIADDWSWGHAGAYGCRWTTTPAFDRVAREGVLFSRAYTPNAKCAPSRASILTGRNSWQLGAAANHVPFFPAEFTTYAEALSAHGYFVGMTAKGWGPGVANDAAGKPRLMAGRPFNRRTGTPPTRGISPIDYAANFEDFLDAAPKGAPWMFWYGAHEPHRAYEYGSGASKGGKKPSDIERVPAYWPDNAVVRNDLLDYALEVEHFDKHLARMLETLEKRGQLADTLVVVTSDHGMPFPRVKAQEYEMSNHVPLAVMWKTGIKHPGRTVDDYVSFIDLAPTFVELAGLRWAESGMQPSPGRSLTDIFSSSKSGRVNPRRDHVLIGKERHDVGRPHDWGYPIRGLVRDGYLYLHNFETSRWPAGNPETGYLECDGGPTKTEVLESRRRGADGWWRLAFGMRPAEELYDLGKDPECMTNLAERPEARARKDALKRQLFAELRAQQDPRMFGRGSVFEEHPYAQDDVRRFYERFMAGEKLRAGWVNESDFEKAPPPR
jgi:N-sulfoglucosamine sulfohydrolase